MCLDHKSLSQACLAKPRIQQCLERLAEHFLVVWSERVPGSWKELGPKGCLSSGEDWPAPSPSTRMPSVPLPLTTSTSSLVPKSHFPPAQLPPAPQPWHPILSDNPGHCRAKPMGSALYTHGQPPPPPNFPLRLVTLPQISRWG